MGPFEHEIEFEANGAFFEVVGEVEYVEREYEEGYATGYDTYVSVTAVWAHGDEADTRLEGEALTKFVGEHGEKVKERLRESYEARCETAREEYAERARYYHR